MTDEDVGGCNFTVDATRRLWTRLPTATDVIYEVNLLDN